MVPDEKPAEPEVVASTSDEKPKRKPKRGKVVEAPKASPDEMKRRRLESAQKSASVFAQRVRALGGNVDRDREALYMRAFASLQD